MERGRRGWEKRTLLLEGRRGGHWPVEGVGDVAAFMTLPMTRDPHSSSEPHSQALFAETEARRGLILCSGGLGRCRCCRFDSSFRRKNGRNE